MENNANQVQVYNPNNQVAHSATDTFDNGYCSLNPTSEAEKKQLVNSLETADFRVSDKKGQVIELKHVYIEKGFKTQDTGEVVDKYRTILFDKDGKSYATGSYGVIGSLKKIFKIYGEPTSWTTTIKVIPTEIPIGNGKNKIVLKIA